MPCSREFVGTDEEAETIAYLSVITAAFLNSPALCICRNRIIQHLTSVHGMDADNASVHFTRMMTGVLKGAGTEIMRWHEELVAKQDAETPVVDIRVDLT